MTETTRQSTRSKALGRSLRLAGKPQDVHPLAGGQELDYREEAREYGSEYRFNVPKLSREELIFSKPVIRKEKGTTGGDYVAPRARENAPGGWRRYLPWSRV